MVDLLERAVELGPFGSESRDDELKHWSNFSTLSVPDRRIVSEVRRGKRLFAFLVSNGKCVLFKYAFINQLNENISGRPEGYTVFELDLGEYVCLNDSHKSEEKLDKINNRSIKNVLKSTLRRPQYLYFAMFFLYFFASVFVLSEMRNELRLIQKMPNRFESTIEKQSKFIEKTQTEIVNLNKEIENLTRIIFEKKY